MLDTAVVSVYSEDMTTTGRNARLAATRLLLHDSVCSGGADCSSRIDHAKRTQHTAARTIVDGTFVDLCGVVHKQYHPTCEVSSKNLRGHMRVDAPMLLELAAVAGIPDTSYP